MPKPRTWRHDNPLIPDAARALESRVLVLAPGEEDVRLLGDALAAERLVPFVCHDVVMLSREIRAGGAAVVVSAEELGAEGLDLLGATLGAQPQWSDWPVVLLCGRDAPCHGAAKSLSNLSLIERPAQAFAVETALRTAVRSRARQYQTRDYITRLRDTDLRKDEFLAMLAHELRNPLQPISTASEVLRMPEASMPEVRKAADVIERQTAHLARLLEDLLDVSRITTGKVVLRRKPLEFGALVGRAVDASRPLFEQRDQKLTLKAPAVGVWVDGDPARLQQVVYNLLQNASKYTHDEGNVEVCLETGDGEARLTIRDDGTGIEPEVLPRIFELFTQADRSLARTAGGLGVGLRIVEAMVALHGGWVRAASEGAGKGSTFKVGLRTIAPPAQAAELARPAIVKAVPRRMLVVDDNVDAAEVLSMLLTSHGHEVEIAYDGLEAMKRAHESMPDVVILDIGLPGANGYEVARAIRRDRPREEVTLVAVTGYGRAEDRDRCFDAGFDMHFVKPMEPQKLLDSLSAH